MDSLWIAALVAGCGGAVATPVPTPSPAPVVTASPTASPTAAPTPSPSATPVFNDITVTLLLTDYSMRGIDFTPDGQRCFGTSGYDDLGQSAQFTVKDTSGELVGFGRFSSRQDEPYTCTFFGTATGIPDLPIYTIEAGHRGPLNYTSQELKDRHWLVELQLGD